MELEADLIEEIARFYGYQNLPTTVPPSRTAGKVSAVYPFQSAARRILLGMGCSETISLTFAAATELARFRAGPGRPVEIRNPLTDETQFLRSSLVPGLMRTARHNLNHGRSNLHVFEIGKVFSREPGGQVLERNRLGILGTGDTAEKNWHNSPAEYDFFHLKGVVSTLLSRMRGPEPEFVPASGIPWLNPGCAAFLELGGARRGVLGELQADVREELRLKQPVFVAEIDFEELYPLLFRPVGFEPLPRFPAAERDVSIVVSRDLEYRDLRQGLLNLGIAELAGLELVDVYEGNQIPAGKVGMTLRFSFQDRQGTLTVDRVQGFSDNIRTFLRDRYGAENR
jgi:phenylalanyl-tRNA synthetase beta chain